MNYIKNQRVAVLFAVVIFFTAIKIVAAFYSGFSAAPFDVFTFLFTEPIRYIFIIACLIAAIIKESIRKRKVLALIALALLILIGLIPTGHYYTLGALLSIQNANPDQFRSEARTLMDQYGAKTKFSDDPPRVLNQYEQFPRSKIPLPILRAHIRDKFVFDKYIFIEKAGLGGSFRGFIVFRDGSDIWKDEKSVTLLEGCSYCWKIRIIDGLYWYHAAPVEEENARLDFLSE
jgi:hypothetical protein